MNRSIIPVTIGALLVLTIVLTPKEQSDKNDFRVITPEEQVELINKQQAELKYDRAEAKKVSKKLMELAESRREAGFLDETSAPPSIPSYAEYRAMTGAQKFQLWERIEGHN